MSIKAALAALDAPADPRCVVGRWLATIAADEARMIGAECRPGSVSTIYGALTSAGVAVPASETTWRRHFTSRCDCPPIDELLS